MKQTILFSLLLMTTLKIAPMNNEPKNQTQQQATVAKTVVVKVIQITNTSSSLYYDYPGANPRISPVNTNPTSPCNRYNFYKN